MFKDIRHDLSSSIVVFFVALPLCLGIALASGAPLFSGILAGIVGGIFVGYFSQSTFSVSGPSAGVAGIIALAIISLGSFEAVLFSIVLAGVFQVLLGILKVGTVGYFFPSSVIKGMFASIGIILILKQIPHALGYDVDFEGDENFFQLDGRNTFSEILEAISHVTPGAMVISLISLIILFFWNLPMVKQYRFLRAIPGALLVVVCGVLLNAFFNSSVTNLALGSEHLVVIPSGSGSFFTFPDFLNWSNPQIYVTAATIAIIASIDTLINIEASDKLDPYKRITPLNRELKVQGAANIILGLLGGLPVTSMIVRSSANITSGARTKMSTIFHGIILLIAISIIPNLLKLIPLSSLAAILILVGYKLTSLQQFKAMFDKGKSQFLPFIITVLAVMFTNLIQGVFIGILVALFFILKANLQRAVIVVNSEGNYLIKFSKDVTFMHKASLRNALLKVPNNTRLLIDGTKSHFMDEDVLETIDDFKETAKIKNIEIEMMGISLKDKTN